MVKTRIADISLKVCCALFIAVSLALTFTVSDYYIFNKIGYSDGEFGFVFVLCQWVKKAGLLLLPLAIYFNKSRCSQAAKYILPVFIAVSMFTFGRFFDVTMLTDDAAPAQKVLASINEFMPKNVNMALFFAAAALELACCALLFVRDGYRSSVKSMTYFALAFVAVTPLNIFENLYNVNAIGRDSPLWFKNFTVWHFLMFAALIGSTIAAYLYLKRKGKSVQRDWLCAIAIAMLIQYHSKDSFVLGEGYNVYNYVFACLPLFICNIGVYIAALSVILKKKTLYSISFFVHAAGALSVFFYFGRDEISNYGIFASHSILYFCVTHVLLFILSVIPSTLGHYKFRLKDCVVPMAYYCVVIVAAALASGLVTTMSMSFSYGGYTLTGNEWLYPNYSFTQINPLPIPCPNVPLTLWKYEFNLINLIILYLVYVSIFWVFTGGYYAFTAIKRKTFRPILAVPYDACESAATTDRDMPGRGRKHDSAIEVKPQFDEIDKTDSDATAR